MTIYDWARSDGQGLWPYQRNFPANMRSIRGYLRENLRNLREIYTTKGCA